MRLGRTLVGMVLMLALAWAASAQQVPYPTPAAPPDEPPKPQYTARVVVAEAEVRCKPSLSPEAYPTSKLRQGEKVEVVAELEGGWLAILPPPGSFSWICTRFLKPINRTTWTVENAVPVQVLCGSSLRDAKPTVIAAEVPRGTQVVGIGPPRAAADEHGLWLPIEPTPRELRYIQASAVEKITAPTPPAAPPAGSGAVTVAAPGSPAASWANAPPPAGTAPAVHPLWQQAQQAEQQGNRAEAIRLYEELGRSVANTDYNLATKAYNQAGYLRSLGQAAAAPGAAPARVHPIPPANDRLQPVPSVLQASAAPSCVPCQTTSSSLGGLYRSHPGRLRPSSRSLEGPTYALEDSQGCLLMYVTPQPGLNLEPYLYHIVEIVGPLYYRGDLRTYHMRAVQVVSVR